MKVSDNIEKYCSYFQIELEKISSLQSERLYKKILIMAMLDTLAYASCPSEESNKKRFLSFIDNYADWPKKNHVSLPQLQLLLANETCQSKLTMKIAERLKSWPLETGPKDDPSQDDEIFSSENQQEKKLREEEKKLREKSTYKNLLYAYRNHLVHEFREPGYAIESDDAGDKPFYAQMRPIESGLKTWELCYPLGFFKKIAESSLNKLTEYFRKGNIDPYSLYRDKIGSLWRR
ncbi:MAG: hypothetical protein Q8J64_09815 [Thermodesulfovibrionales bacterium]|nr:hypothetical protein [Thermodesulfovibrionales bacterium]